jgi:AcrR family transcriptional regulator
LTDWTVDDISKRADCAKGLITYHFQSKTRLLQLVATQVRADRSARRTAALSHSGADGLDDLWEALAEEVRSGGFRLWLALLAYPGTADSATIDTASRQYLVTAAATTLGLQATSPSLQAIPTFLDGLELQLLMGVPETELREQFDRFWLDLLNTAGAG